jgi:hypothetical protein
MKIYIIAVNKVPGAGLEPAQHQVPRDFKSLVSADSTTRAYNIF